MSTELWPIHRLHTFPNASNVRTLADPRDPFLPAKSHFDHVHTEPHRQAPDAIAAKARCGPVRAVCVRRRNPPTLIDSSRGRSVAPIFRGTANALGLHAGGIFVSAFAKEVWNKRASRDPEASGHAGPRQGKRRTRRCGVIPAVGAAPGCLGAGRGAVRRKRIAALKQAAMRSRILIGDSGTGFCPVRCARRCRGVCRCRFKATATTLAQLGEQQLRMLSVAGSSPAR